MGIHGSATCSIRYEGATGWLIGDLHRGLAAMFLMMNSARLHVGLQGLGHLEMATQNARRHAQDRVQGGGPIAQHPAMRHTLLRLQARTEALRCMAYRAALALDEAAHHESPERRAQQSALAALLTPIVKAYGTQLGFEGAHQALQVFGGYGYVRETGVEQTLRDARIALIYEGTNEIQAIDLVQRKLLSDEGRALGILMAELETEAAAALAAGLPEAAQALREQIAHARRGLADLQAAAAQGRETVLVLCDDALAAYAHLCLAWAWTASSRACMQVLAERPDDDEAAQRLERMRYGLQWLLPQAQVHWQALGVQRVLPAVCA